MPVQETEHHLTPLVSIIVPIYNVEMFLNKCVDSIIGQTYSNLEIILVDDGTPDGSGQLAEQYSKEDCRVKVLHKQNGGLSDARNAGMEIATGDYLCFVDSDDYVDPHMVEASLTEILKRDSDVVIFGFYNENVLGIDTILSRVATYLDLESLVSMVSVIGYAWNKLYKASYLKNYGIRFIKGISLVEDVVFNEKALMYTERIEFLNRPLYHYVNRERPSLIKQFHQDSYKLQKMGFKCKRAIMTKLFSGNRSVLQVLAEAHVNGIRYSLSNMFYMINQMPVRVKYNNIVTIVNDDVTREQIRNYAARNFSDRVIKASLVFKLPLVLLTIYSVRSYFIRKRWGVRNG